MTRLAVHVDFVANFSDLDPAARDEVRTALARFAELKPEPVPGARDDRIRTVRLGPELRAAVVEPSLLLSVGPGVPEWARRRVLSVNAVSGVLEVTDADELDRVLPDLRKAADDGGPPLLFGRLSDERLTALGISPDVLAVARVVRTPAQLRTRLTRCMSPHSTIINAPATAASARKGQPP